MAYSDYSIAETTKNLGLIGSSQGAFSGAVREVVSHAIGAAACEGSFDIMNSLFSSGALRHSKTGELKKDGQRVLAYVRFYYPAGKYNPATGAWAFAPNAKGNTKKIATGRFVINRERSKNGVKVYSKEYKLMDPKTYSGLKHGLIEFEGLTNPNKKEAAPAVTTFDAASIGKYLEKKLEVFSHDGEVTFKGDFEQFEAAIAALEKTRDRLIQNLGKSKGWIDRSKNPPATEGNKASNGQAGDFAGNVPSGAKAPFDMTA